MKEGFDNIYTVANPHTTNSFTVTNGLTGIEVYKYNGVRWELVDSGYVTYSGSTVTVTNGGLD
jgi:hypothetical protein